MGKASRARREKIAKVLEARQRHLAGRNARISDVIDLRVPNMLYADEFVGHWSVFRIDAVFDYVTSKWNIPIADTMNYEPTDDTITVYEKEGGRLQPFIWNSYRKEIDVSQLGLPFPWCLFEWRMNPADDAICDIAVAFNSLSRYASEDNPSVLFSVYIQTIDPYGERLALRHVYNGALELLEDNFNFRVDSIVDPDTAKFHMHMEELVGHEIDYTNGAIGLLLPVIEAIRFLNCRNVELVDHEPDPELSRKHERHFGQPMTRYKTLHIKPVRKQYDTEREGERQKRDLPLHIVRGHFATYTDAAPLFGKYVGTYWIPAHVRGDEKHGMVVKDYNVQAPEEDN